MDNYTQLFDLFEIIAGVYMLYCAITGKGSIYKNENLKKGVEEKYKKYVRWFCLYGGLLAVATGVLDYFRIEPFAMILFAILSLYIILFIVIIVRFNEPRNTKHL